MQILWQDKKLPSRADRSLLGKEVKANYSNDSGVMSLMPFIPRVILFKQTQTMTYLDTNLTSFLLDYCVVSEKTWGSPQGQSRTEAFYRLTQVCKPALQYSLLHSWSGCNCLYCRSCDWHLRIPSEVIAFWEQLGAMGRRISLCSSITCMDGKGQPLGLAQYQCAWYSFSLSPHLSLIDGKLGWEAKWRSVTTSWKNINDNF